MGTKATPQTAMDEGLIEDEKLEKALEDREKKRKVKSDATADFKDADDVVKGKLDALELDEGATVRCGRFRISKKSTPARDVSFTTEPSSQLQITPDSDD